MDELDASLQRFRRTLLIRVGGNAILDNVSPSLGDADPTNCYAKAREFLENFSRIGGARSDMHEADASPTEPDSSMTRPARRGVQGAAAHSPHQPDQPPRPGTPPLVKDGRSRMPVNVVVWAFALIIAIVSVLAVLLW